MSIWFDKSLTLDQMQNFAKGTMNEFIGIEFTEVGENYLKAKMPVAARTRQAYGLLHGGASATLAETIGSVASAMVLDQKSHFCVGLEINANHISSVKEGWVYATALPLHLGRTTHVWDIKIINEKEKIVCVSRLTVAIIKRPD